jgi:hypothetical protein
MTVIFPSTVTRFPVNYRVRARTVSEQTFLALGPGAAVWLKEAAAVARLSVKFGQNRR